MSCLPDGGTLCIPRRDTPHPNTPCTLLSWYKRKPPDETKFGRLRCAMRGPRCSRLLSTTLSFRPMRRGPRSDGKARHAGHVRKVRQGPREGSLSDQEESQDRDDRRAQVQVDTGMDRHVAAREVARQVPVRPVRVVLASEVRHVPAVRAPHSPGRIRLVAAPRPCEPHHPLPVVPRAGRCGRDPSERAREDCKGGERARGHVTAASMPGRRFGPSNSGFSKYPRSIGP